MNESSDMFIGVSLFFNLQLFEVFHSNLPCSYQIMKIIERFKKSNSMSSSTKIATPSKYSSSKRSSVSWKSNKSSRFEGKLASEEQDPLFSLNKFEE